MNDYRLTFPVTALVAGIAGVRALRERSLQSNGDNEQNALGDPLDATGSNENPDPSAPIGTPPPEVWYGRPGSAATSYTDLGKWQRCPGAGQGHDPALYYVHIRSSHEAKAFRPGLYGMKDSDPTASAAVLGIWLGDTPP